MVDHNVRAEQSADGHIGFLLGIWLMTDCYIEHMEANVSHEPESRAKFPWIIWGRLFKDRLTL